MSLSDIKNKLYKKEAEPDLAKHQESSYDPKNIPRNISADQKVDDLWAEKQLEINKEHKKKVIKIGAYAFSGIVAILLILIIVFFINKSLFSNAKVTVSVTGETNVGSGDPLSYVISYNNDNFMGLKNVTLKLTYPENFQPENNDSFKADSATSGTVAIGDIAPHAGGKITFSGRVYSPKGALMYLKADLAYSPKSYSSQYIASNQLGINVTSSPVIIEVLAPQNVSSGDEVNYAISYKNSGEKDMENIVIRADYPDGFTFSHSDPVSLESNNVWYIGHLSAGQGGQIIATGKLEGGGGQSKKIVANVGTNQNGNFISYNEENAQTNIAVAPFIITQTVNGLANLSVNAGDNLVFKIDYKNNENFGLRNVIITEKIDSPVLDYTTLQMDKGAFDNGNKIITWKASDYPDLANLGAGQGGTIYFTVRVKNILPINSANDKNFVISSVAKIDSPDVPTPVNGNKIISGNGMDIRLNSKLVLDVKGYYYDSDITNSGPIPPKVNQETTYALHFSIINVSNDITGAKVDAVLPTDVIATGQVYPDNAKITYDSRTNSVSWDIGNVSAGTGILNPPLDAAFQVKIKPGANLLGREVGLLDSSVLSATDTFTQQNLTAAGDKKTTNLVEDTKLNFRKDVTQ